MGPATRSSNLACVPAALKAPRNTRQGRHSRTRPRRLSSSRKIRKYQRLLTSSFLKKNMSSHVRQDVDVKPGRDMKKVSISSSSDEGLGDLSVPAPPSCRTSRAGGGRLEGREDGGGKAASQLPAWPASLGMGGSRCCSLELLERGSTSPASRLQSSPRSS